MPARAKAMSTLIIAAGVLTFLWVEFVLNFDFHWFTVKDHVLGGLGLPRQFQLVLPASFVGWGLFFALGADGVRKTIIAAVTGTAATVVVILLGSATADAPDFWGIALWGAVAVMALVLLSSARADDRLSPAPALVCFATAFYYWIATGMDNYVPSGNGPHTVQGMVAALTGKPLAAGAGAFGGLLSTSWEWVAVDALASIVCGALLGVLTVRLAGVLGAVLAKLTQRREGSATTVAA